MQSLHEVFNGGYDAGYSACMKEQRQDYGAGYNACMMKLRQLTGPESGNFDTVVQHLESYVKQKDRGSALRSNRGTVRFPDPYCIRHFYL